MRRALITGVAALAALSAIPVAYTIYISVRVGHGWLPSTYMQGMMGNWLATIMGVGAGLPIALWLNRRVEARADRINAVHAATQRQRVISVLQRELEHNAAPLAQAAAGNVTRAQFFVGRWHALMAGGELHWLTDLELLDLVAGAYETLDVVNMFASRWLVTLGEPDHGSDAGADTVKRLLVDAAGDSLDAVRGALAAFAAKGETGDGLR